MSKEHSPLELYTVSRRYAELRQRLGLETTFTETLHTQVKTLLDTHTFNQVMGCFDNFDFQLSNPGDFNPLFVCHLSVLLKNPHIIEIGYVLNRDRKANEAMRLFTSPFTQQTPEEEPAFM